MQIHSYEVTDRIYDPVRLEGDYPVAGGEPIIVGSTPHFLHRHNVLEIGYCYEGCGVFIIGDDMHPFAPGDVSVIDSGVFHIARSSEESSRWSFAHIDPCRFTTALSPGSQLHRVAELHKVACPPLLRANEYPDASGIVKEIFSEILGADQFHWIAVAGLIALLSSRLYRISARTDEAARHTDNYAMERIAPALQHIAARYADNITVSELADLCCISVAQLRRLFHQAVRQSPQDYITKFRLGMAVSLLGGTTLSVIDISGRVGYSSVSSFNRHFKSQFGISPRQWRRGTDQ